MNRAVRCRGTDRFGCTGGGIVLLPRTRGRWWIEARLRGVGIWLDSNTRRCGPWRLASPLRLSRDLSRGRLRDRDVGYVLVPVGGNRRAVHGWNMRGAINMLRWPGGLPTSVGPFS